MSTEEVAGIAINIPTIKSVEDAMIERWFHSGEMELKYLKGIYNDAANRVIATTPEDLNDLLDDIDDLEFSRYLYQTRGLQRK